MRTGLRMIVAAALLVGGGAAADEPPLPWVGDIWTRERLTGDWGGARTSLAENYGIEFEVDTTQYFQGVASGGFDDNGGLEYSGHADYRLHLNTGKAGLWPGGFLLVHGNPTGAIRSMLPPAPRSQQTCNSPCLRPPATAPT